ncbi:hypothetical protein LCGC14_2992170, partial [marine sediment metagenome]
MISVMYFSGAFYKSVKITFDNSPLLKQGASPTYTLRGFRVWSS